MDVYLTIKTSIQLESLPFLVNNLWKNRDNHWHDYYDDDEEDNHGRQDKIFYDDIL